MLDGWSTVGCCSTLFARVLVDQWVGEGSIEGVLVSVCVVYVKVGCKNNDLEVHRAAATQSSRTRM